MLEVSTSRYTKASEKEILVSGSDDFTLFMWDISSKSKKPLLRLVGHQQPISHVVFSPDGQYIASSSFDRSVKVWQNDGKLWATFRGHVDSVYQVCSKLLFMY